MYRQPDAGPSYIREEVPMPTPNEDTPKRDTAAFAANLALLRRSG